MINRCETRTGPIVSNSGGRVQRVDVRLGETQIRQLIADYQAGAETSSIQLRYGLSKGAVRQILSEAAVTPHRRSLTDEQAKRCVALYEAGQTIREVASVLDVPKTTVQNALRRLGVQARPAQRRSARTRGRSTDVPTP